MLENFFLYLFVDPFKKLKQLLMHIWKAITLLILKIVCQTVLHNLMAEQLFEVDVKM